MAAGKGLQGRDKGRGTRARGIVRQRRRVLPCRPVRQTRMTTLTVTAEGEVTFPQEVLRHLGVRPGETIALDLLPEARAELRAEPKGSWDDMVGFLGGKTHGARLSIEEIGEAIAQAGAAAGLGEL